MNIGIDVIIDDNPNVCRKISDNNIKTLYFRNFYGKNLKENQHLREVKNSGEI